MSYTRRLIETRRLFETRCLNGPLRYAEHKVTSIRPPLSKKSFFPPNFNFFKLECTGGKVKKKKKFEKMKKKSSSRPFLAHPASGQETTFYLRVA